MSMPGTRWGAGSGERLVIWLCVALVGAALLQIAIFTRFNAHPDEGIHADAFCYFEGAWWPPELNDPALIYSPDGISRVYNGELVYLLFGQAAAVVRPALAPLIDAAQPQPAPAQVITNVRRTFFPLIGTAVSRCNPFVYRILNVGLYLVTVGSLLAIRHSPPWPARIALLMLCVPQVAYLYAYANSDAWGLSLGIWLFVFVLAQRRRLLSSWLRLQALGLLVGLVLLAKSPSGRPSRSA